MRILHVISAPGAGGAETYVKQLAIELRRMGHHLTIAFLGHAADDGRNVSFEEAYLTELESNGIDHLFIGYESRRRPWLGAWRIRRFCRVNAFDLYHSHLIFGLVFGALLRIPRVYTHHSIIHRGPPWTFKFCNVFVERYVGISHVCSAMLRKFSGRDVITIRNGINLTLFPRRLRERNLDSNLSCISIGRIFPEKNYPALIRAIDLLPGSLRHRIRLSIVGEGAPTMVQKLEEQIAAAGLGSRIRLLGNRQDIRELLASADLFLMSSAWEGFPISLLEATASGLPFIATDVGGCREMAELCGNGIIVPPADPRALADAIAKLMHAPESFSRLSRAACESAPRLSIQNAAKQHVKVYESLVAKRAGREQESRPR